MTRYVGVLGIKNPATETSPGIYEETISEISLRGNIERDKIRWRGGALSQNTVTANVSIRGVISETTLKRVVDVVYATWGGRKWIVTSIQYTHPNVRLSLGEVYNG